jgi:hypothetical protein
MQRLWYYTVGGTEQRGPITEDELLARVRSGEVAPTELVWSEGMTDWAAISARPEFRIPEAPARELAGATPDAARRENLATPPDFGPWISIVGISNIVFGSLLTATCIGVPLGVLMIFAGAAALGAKAPLKRLGTVSADVALALSKFRTFFALTGVILLLNFAFALFVLINMSGLAITLSKLYKNFE